MDYYSSDKISKRNSEESPVITYPTVRCETEEQNLLDENMTSVKEEYVEESHDLISDVKFEDRETVWLTAVKHEPEERNFFDQHVTAIKEEYVDHSQNLTSEIQFDEDPILISSPAVKREPKEEQSVLDTLKEEPSVEVTAEDKKYFTERCHWKD
ncbi:uncharacterized protein [Periplaneta americana]|uniref:uncharacterized protein isoform X3 n=1 Tax=Periplaneta americana TaxID=6978 RepID=UPI0037E6FC00